MKKFVKTRILSKLEKKVPVFIPVSDNKCLTGRTAFISGGTSGIGFAVAKCYLQAGAQVMIAGRNRQKLDNAVAQLQAYGSVMGAQMDISDVDALQDSFETIVKDTMGTIDILVNCAGVNFGGVYGSISEEDFDRVISTNLKGTLFLSQLASNYMIANNIRGNILNVASAGAFRPANTAYRISKWGVRGMTLGMAKSLIPHGIVVNGIAPGPTATDMLGASNDNLTREKSPSGRMATAEEIAEMAKLLVSDAGRLVVGEIVSMSGGGGVITYDDVGY